MNRLINSVLISVVAFFGLLSAFVLAGLHGVDGGSSGQAQIKGVVVAWGDSSGGQVPLEVSVAIHHGGTVPTQAVSVSYQALVDGKVVDEGTSELDALVAAGKDTTLTFTSPLGSDFASTWWPAHLDGEGSTLVVRGDLRLLAGETQRSLPFEWTSTWQGDLRRVFEPLQDCPQASAAVCLGGTTTNWSGPALRATVLVTNQGAFDLQVREGTMALRLGDEAVALAMVPAVALPAHATTEVQVDFRFDDRALDRWWPDHARRCEASDAQATLRLDLRDAFGWDAGTAAWATTSTYTTAFVCAGAP